MWFSFPLIFLIFIASVLCFKWWQMHPSYGKNIGPPVLPFIGSFLSLVRNQHRMYDWATELLQHSPSLTIRNVLFGIELYTTANPANVEHMLKTNFRNYTKGFRFQSLMHDMLGHGIFNADGELWKAQRKAASYEFTSNSLKTFMLETVQTQISDRLLPMLYAHISNSSCSRCKPSPYTCGAYCSTCKPYSLDTCRVRGILPCTCASSCKKCGTSYNTSPCHDGASYCTPRSLYCIHQTPLDFQDIFLRFAFDNVCKISLGVDPACLNNSLQNHSFAKAFDDATELIVQRFFAPAWIWKLKRFLNVGSERKLKRALHIVHSFAMEVIHKRKAEYHDIRSQMKDEAQEPTDLLFRLLGVATQTRGDQSDSELTNKVSEEKHADPSAFGKMARERVERKSDELLRDMIISFLLAGRDTSSIALSWFFWLIILHPLVEAAIYEEIMRVVRGRKKSGFADAGNFGRAHDVDDSSHAHVGDDPAHDIDAVYVNSVNNSTLNHGRYCNDPFTYKELKEMQYLQAALQETMRLYPPVPHDTKLAVEGDVLPDGTRVRGGAQLAYHAYAMGRIPSLWGEDSAMFRPERWLVEDGDGLVNESPFRWPVFQAGPRICLGKDMAMLQMKCVAAALIQRFTFSMPPAVAAGTSFSSPSYSLSFTLKMQDGLPLLLHPRQ